MTPQVRKLKSVHVIYLLTCNKSKTSRSSEA